MSDRRTCRHCDTRVISRPRRLCFNCYYRPDVSALYPSSSAYARRGVGGKNTAGRLPAEPTDAAPGTAAKVAVMEERAAAGVALFHPADADGT